MKEPSYIKKICILGDPAVGKTSLVGRFVLSQFGEEYVSTIGASVMEKSLDIGTGSARKRIDFVIWDIAGQHQFTSVTPGFYRGAEGAMLVCDLTRRETIRNLAHWEHQFHTGSNSRTAVILFNKSDLSGKTEITREEAEAESRRMGLPCLFTSARSGANVEDAFRMLAEKMAGMK